MRFEWDEVKRNANIGKHSIDFADAPQVFDNAFVVVEDERFDYGESRFLAFGLLFGIVVVVAYTMPEEDVIRAVSMRKATIHEERRFFEYFSD